MSKNILTKRIRRDIQILRAISVIAVICYHANSNFFSYGYLGVDVFFLISGYLIIPQVAAAADTFNKKHMLSNIFIFLQKRFYRIAPALGVSVSFSAVLGFFFLNPIYSFTDGNFITSLSAIFGLANFAAFRASGNYFNSSNPYIHYWSIGVEIQAYIFFSAFFVILYFIYRGMTNEVLYLRNLIILFLLSLVIYYFVQINQDFFSYLDLKSFASSPDQFNFYFLPSRIWQFALGGIFALYKISYKLPENLKINISITLFGLLTAILLNPSFQFSHEIVKYFTCVITLGILSLKSNNFKENWINEFLVWVGDRSYSLYLYHLPFIMAFSGSYVPQNYRLFGLIFSLAMCLLISNLSYLYIEKRFHNYKRKKIDKQKYFLLTLINYSYFIPIVILFITTFVSMQTNRNLSEVSWDNQYAASNRSKCPLGQVEYPCELTNNPNNQNWLLIGDSHAGSLQNMIAQIANKNSATLYVWNKCRFFDPEYSNRLNKFFPEWCIEANKERIKFIRERDISILFIAFANVPVRNGDTIMPQSLFESSFEFTLKNVSKQVQKVISFHSTPFFIDSIVGRPRISLPAAKAVPLNQVTGINQDWPSSYENLLIQNLSQINISKVICDNFKCVRFKNGSFLYVDNNHLSIRGANLVTPLTEKAITTN